MITWGIAVGGPISLVLDFVMLKFSYSLRCSGSVCTESFNST